MTRYVKVVLKGKFPTIRYDIERNEHLRKIFKWNPGLQSSWMESVPLESIEVEIPNKGTAFFQIGLSDDPQNLVLVGDEARRTCMSVTGSPEYNKGLTYMLVGPDKLIVVESSVKIVARAILRLLVDKKKKEVVLFLEKIYSNGFEGEFLKEITAYAIRMKKNSV